MFDINKLLFLFNEITEPVTTTADGFKALICFVNKLIYKLMGDNGFGGNGRVHVICLTLHMKNNYYSKLVLYITEFNGLFRIVRLVFFKFFAHIQYENLAHYLF